ncbi:stage III sporulation protein AE [Clostridium sp. DL1XJH146]
MKKIIVFLSIILILSINVVQADENNSKDEFGNTNFTNFDGDSDSENEIESLYNYITKIQSQYEMLHNINLKDYVNLYIENGNGELSFENVFKALVYYSVREVSTTGELMLMIIIITIICALIERLEGAFSNENLRNVAFFSVYALLIIILSRSFFIGVDLAKETMVAMTDFMDALIPVLLILLAGVGGVAEAAILDPLILGATSIAAKIFVNVLVPLISVSFVLVFVNNISEDYKVEKLAKLINSIVLWIQGITMTIFIGIITIKSTASATIDAVTEKTIKFAVDSFVPIVGGCLSDAVSTVAGYSLLLKNALSSLGLLVIIAIVIAPIIKLLVIAFLYKIVAAVIEPVGNKKIVSTITSVGDSLILITSCLISVSIMFFIMISIMATAGRSILNG